ncbi:unnamed protein product [Schistosoma turkestanicum]|nr:unnamed protein product [Schistosoma turkestanicum]
MLLNTNRPFDILNRSGFDKQYEEYKQGMHLTQCVMNIFQEKCELQSNYSRALSGLSDRLRDALAKTTGGTIHTAWLRIATALEMESQLNESIVQNLLTNLIQPLNNLIETFKKDKKSLKKCVDKETNNLFSLYTMEFHARHKLFTCFRHYEQVYYNYHMESTGDQENQSNPTNHGYQKRSLSMNRFDITNISPVIDTTTSNNISFKHNLLTRRNSIHVDATEVNTTISELSNDDSSPCPSSIVTSRFSSLYTSLPYKKKYLKDASVTSTDCKPNITRHHSSLSSSGDANGRKCLTIDKLRDAYYTSLTHYYRTCLSAEEARIDWHWKILKCLSDQQTLENDRLTSLTHGLQVYRNTLDNALPIWKAALNELANAISLADPLIDLQNFRYRSHHQEELSQLSVQQLTNSKQKLTDNSSMNAKHVGWSLQRLIDLPCEHVLLQQQQQHQQQGSSSSPSLKSPALNMTRRSKVQTSIDKNKETVPTKVTDSTSHVIIQSYLTKWSILTILDLLTKDIEKERRTKRGLSNLVQVYAHQPSYTDVDTLMKARHRLYCSRVRLTYLLLCHQKLTQSLKQIHANSIETKDIDHKLFNSFLQQAGFSKLILTPHTCSEFNYNNKNNITIHSNHDPKNAYLITSRWIGLPDLDRLTDDELNLIEWPPFPVQDIIHENINNDLFQLDIEQIRDQLKTQSFHMVNSTHHNIDNGTVSSDIHPPFNNHSITEEDLLSHNNLCSIRSTNLISTKTTRNNANMIEKPCRSTLKNSLHFDGKPHNNIIPNDQSLEINNRFSTTKQSSDKVIIPKKQSPALSRIQSDRISHTITTTTTATTTTSHISSSLSTVKNNINNISKHSMLDYSKNSHKPIVPLVIDEIETDDSMDKYDTSTSSSSVPPAAKSSITSENIENSKEMLPNNSFWSRLTHGLRGGLPNNNKQQQQSNLHQPDIKLHQNSNNLSVKKSLIIKSEISEPSCLRIVHIPTGSCSLDSGNNTGSINDDDDDAEDNGDNLNLNVEMESSINLRCLGWAKVQRNYLPRNSNEIHLQEGDIVSIYRKTNADWWYGEVNGTKGYFPVNHIEEF